VCVCMQHVFCMGSWLTRTSPSGAAARSDGGVCHVHLGVPPGMAEPFMCLWGADCRDDWTARVAAAGRLAMTLLPCSLELRELPSLTPVMMSSAA